MRLDKPRNLIYNNCLGQGTMDYQIGKTVQDADLDIKTRGFLENDE